MNYQVKFDDEIFLSDVPLSLIKNSLKKQFDEPWEYKKRDYIQSFVDNYNLKKDNMTIDDKDEMEESHDQFISYVIKLFDVYLGIGFPNIEDMDDDDQHELLQLTYRFFINNIKKNITTFIYNYISQNINEISETLPRKKDITTMNFKSEIPDEDVVIILSNLSDVITYIFTQEYNVDEFLDLCEKNSTSTETEFVRDKYESFDITGNFVEKYFMMITEYDIVEIESIVRRKILKNYPQRKTNDVKPVETDVEE